MIKLTPLLLAVLYGFLAYRFSVWRTSKALDEQSTRLTDPVLRVLTDQMAQALDLKEIPVYVYEIDPINGLAAPDGRIFITRGFMKRYRDGAVTGAELSSVIAHELGHVALGHSRRRMIDFSGQNAARVVLATVIGRFIPFVGPMIANGLMRMLAAGLSRRDEYEADAYAAALLTKAGIGTAPQKELFAKLENLTGTAAAGAPAWLMSHPKTAERIAAIEGMEARWTTSEPPKLP